MVGHFQYRELRSRSLLGLPSIQPPAPPCIHPLSGAWGRPLNKGGRSVGIALPSFYNFKLREINWNFSDGHLWSGKFMHEWFSSVLRQKSNLDHLVLLMIATMLFMFQIKYEWY